MKRSPNSVNLVVSDVGLFASKLGVTVIRYAKTTDKRGDSHQVVINDGRLIKLMSIPDAKFTTYLTALKDSVITAAHLFLNPPNSLQVTPEARHQLELISSNKELNMAVEKTTTTKKTAKFAAAPPEKPEKAVKTKKATKPNGGSKDVEKADNDNDNDKVAGTRDFVLTEAEPEEGVRVTELIQVGLDLFKKTKGEFNREQLTAAMSAAYPDDDEAETQLKVAKCKRRMVRKGFAEVEGAVEANAE